jgi:hypothetical protein
MYCEDNNTLGDEGVVLCGASRSEERKLGADVNETTPEGQAPHSAGVFRACPRLPAERHSEGTQLRLSTAWTQLSVQVSPCNPNTYTADVFWTSSKLRSKC